MEKNEKIKDIKDNKKQKQKQNKKNDLQREGSERVYATPEVGNLEKRLQSECP